MSVKWPEWLRELARAHQKQPTDETRMMWADGMNRWRLEMLDAGLCTCGNALVGGRQQCADCAVKHSFRTEKRRARLRSSGVCVTCGKRPAREGMAACEPCAEVDRKFSREASRELREVGLCLKCKAPTKQGKVKCPKCRRSETKAQTSRYRERKASGKCAACDQPMPGKGWYCKPCAEKRNVLAKARRQRNGEAEVVEAMKVVLEYETEWFATGMVVKDERYLVAKQLVERRAV